MSALMRMLLSVVAGILPVAFLAGGLAGAQAGSGALGAQTLRPFAHVFIAYALAWLLVIGWTWSIARRLGKVERRLER